MAKLVMRFLCRDTDKQYEEIKEVKNYQEVKEYLFSIGEFPERYTRMWVEGADLVMDYGSWSKYAIVRFESDDAAMRCMANGGNEF